MAKPTLQSAWQKPDFETQKYLSEVKISTGIYEFWTCFSQGPWCLFWLLATADQKQRQGSFTSHIGAVAADWLSGSLQELQIWERFSSIMLFCLVSLKGYTEHSSLLKEGLTLTRYKILHFYFTEVITAQPPLPVRQVWKMLSEAD